MRIIIAIILLLPLSFFQNTSNPSLSLIISNSSVEVGQVFTVDIVVNTENSFVDTVDSYIDFDPNYLEVVDKNGQPFTQIELNSDVFNLLTYNVVDNSIGKISASASQIFNPYLSGTFRFATIRFRAKELTGNIELKFIRSGVRWSDVYLGGNSINPELNNIIITINQITSIPLLIYEYLPIVNSN